MGYESQVISVNYFKGIRNDVGRKFVGPDYYDNAVNFNANQLIGANRDLYPRTTFDFDTNDSIDGLVQYDYLNASSLLVTEYVGVQGGKIYTNILSTPVLLKSGLQTGLCTFQVMNDKLFICNGKNYPQVYNGTNVYEMGAPSAFDEGIPGSLSGNYYYAMTFVTSAGEEVIGTVSNTINVTSRAIFLKLTIGYTGTISRNIYRTEANGNILYKLTEIADNTTLTYVDYTLDTDLGSVIPAINNECPKPYFLELSFQRLIGGVSDQYPTQIWNTAPNVEVFDLASSIDIINYDSDNSVLVGLNQDYSQILAGTGKNIFFINYSAEDPVVTPTRANVGVKNGYSMVRIPRNGTFPGGVLFLSTLNDIRLFNGNLALPVATSLDNLNTDDYSQQIRRLLLESLSDQNAHIYGEFFEYKYNLIIGNLIFFYDIRTGQWFTRRILTESYSPKYSVISVMNNKQYLGQLNHSIIEEDYAEESYLGESCEASLNSVEILGDIKYADFEKYWREFYIYFNTAYNKTITVTITFDSDVNNPIVSEIVLDNGSYSARFFNDDYDQSTQGEDFRVIYLNRYARYVTYEITSTDAIVFKGYKITYDLVTNMETLR